MSNAPWDDADEIGGYSAWQWGNTIRELTRKTERVHRRMYALGSTHTSTGRDVWIRTALETLIETLADLLMRDGYSPDFWKEDQLCPDPRQPTMPKTSDARASGSPARNSPAA